MSSFQIPESLTSQLFDFTNQEKVRNVDETVGKKISKILRKNKIQGSFFLDDWNVRDTNEMKFKHTLPCKRVFTMTSYWNARRKLRLWQMGKGKFRCSCRQNEVEKFNAHLEEIVANDARFFHNFEWFNNFAEVGSFIGLCVSDHDEKELGEVGALNLNNVEVVEQAGQIFFDGDYATSEFTASLKSARRAALSFLKQYMDIGIVSNQRIRFKADEEEARGPSSGLGICAAIVSLFIQVPIANFQKVAFTGCCDFKGRISAVGGIIPKVIAASLAGMETVYVPEGNRYELTLNPIASRNNIKIIYVLDFHEVAKNLFPRYKNFL